MPEESFGELLLWGQRKAGRTGNTAYMQLLQILARSGETEPSRAFYEGLAQRSAELLGRTAAIAPPQLRQRYRQNVEDWIDGKPLEYILGFADFGAYSFAVGPGVLIPREDSEVLLRQSLACVPQCKGEQLRALELCCGSFCIGLLWYQKHVLRRRCSLWGSDISAEALYYARKNRAELFSEAVGDEAVDTARVHIVESDLFSALQGQFHIIFANPPYLSKGEFQRRSDWREPRLALAAGYDGLAVLRKIIQQSPRYLYPGGFLLLEAAPWQMHELGMLLEAQGFAQRTVHRDAAGCERVIAGRLLA